jgi:hypothetical protein
VSDESKLAAEIAVLRRQVYALWAGILAVAAVALFWMQRPGGTNLDGDVLQVFRVEARDYHLIDPDGRLRGLFRAPPAGPSLELLDQDGRVRAAIRPAYDIPAEAGKGHAQ